MAIASIVVRVDFVDGRSAAFSLSPCGRLDPLEGDGTTTATQWGEAAEALAEMPRMEQPPPHATVRVMGGACWPWHAE
jgi:hypothetical protein